MESKDNLLILTGVDGLLRLVRENGAVNLVKASKILEVPSHTAELWADTLEERGEIVSKFGFRERRLMSPDYTISKIILSRRSCGR